MEQQNGEPESELHFDGSDCFLLPDNFVLFQVVFGGSSILLHKGSIEVGIVVKASLGTGFGNISSGEHQRSGDFQPLFDDVLVQGNAHVGLKQMRDVVLGNKELIGKII